MIEKLYVIPSPVLSWMCLDLDIILHVFVKFACYKLLSIYGGYQMRRKDKDGNFRTCEGRGFSVSGQQWGTQLL